MGEANQNLTAKLHANEPRINPALQVAGAMVVKPMIRPGTAITMLASDCRIVEDGGPGGPALVEMRINAESPWTRLAPGQRCWVVEEQGDVPAEFWVWGLFPCVQVIDPSQGRAGIAATNQAIAVFEVANLKEIEREMLFGGGQVMPKQLRSV